MSITAPSGPLVAYGVTTTSTGNGLTGADFEHNDQRAPSLFDLANGMLDPRSFYNYDPGAGPTSKVFGFLHSRGFVDYVPITASTSGTATLYGSSNTSSGVTGNFTLAAASSANGTYSTTIIAPETGNATGTLIAIDSTAAYVTFGSAGTVAAWNPAAGTGRCVVITTSSSGDGGTFSIAGRDMYGFKMTETLAVSQGTSNSSGFTIKSQKAFKYISAISNTSTPTSTSVWIGFGDTFGFPLAVSYCGIDTQVNMMATSFSSAVTVPLSSANTVLASTVATQTSTTPDVRGTYASSTATNGTLRVQMRVTPSVATLAAITSTNVSGLFGGTQFSSV